MNKKNKILIILLIIIIAIIGAMIMIASNSELVINDVAGVNNVKLNKSVFSESDGISDGSVGKGKDNFHGINGDVSLKYLITNDNIIFSNTTEKYNETKFYSNSGWIIDDGYTTIEKMTIAGIKGYYITDNQKAINENVRLGDTFVFVINDTVYSISLSSENNPFPSLINNKEGISLMLSAWLEASGLKQTWDYPNTTSTTVNSETKTTNNDNVNQGNDNTKVINGVIYTQEEDGLIYELHPGDPGYEKEIKKYS